MILIMIPMNMMKEIKITIQKVLLYRRLHSFRNHNQHQNNQYQEWWVIMEQAIGKRIYLHLIRMIVWGKIVSI